MIYRFTQPIFLKDGTVIGNRNPQNGPLGGEAFLDEFNLDGTPANHDNETAKAIIAQCEKEKKEAEANKISKQSNTL